MTLPPRHPRGHRPRSSPPRSWSPRQPADMRSPGRPGAGGGVSHCAPSARRPPGACGARSRAAGSIRRSGRGRGATRSRAAFLAEDSGWRRARRPRRRYRGGAARGPARRRRTSARVDRRQRARRHRQDDPLDGPALAAEGRLDEAVAEAAGVLADDPAVIEPNVAAGGESRDGVGRAVGQLVLAVQRFDRAGEADHVARGQGDRLRPVERELRRLGERHRRRVGDDEPFAFLKALGVLVELDHVAGPVGVRLAPLGLARRPPAPAG